VLPDFRWPRFLGQANAFVQQVGQTGPPWGVFMGCWDGSSRVHVLVAPRPNVLQAIGLLLLSCLLRLGCFM
jgi:hypothetical protein